MIQRRPKAAGIETRISNHSFRATGITAYLKNDGLLEHAQQIAAHTSPRTTKGPSGNKRAVWRKGIG